MENSNLLSGGVDTLNEIKENLLELHGYQSNYDTLLLEEDRLEKSIKNLDKDISDEIQSTTKKRRQEIEDTFDKQLDKIRAKIRKTKEKRDKRKNTKISERIEIETASLKEENNKLRQESKEIFRQHHVPSFCNTKLYYALYSPGGFVDLFIILCSLFVTLFVIPCGIYFVLLPKEKTIYLIIIYIITVLLFGGLYVFVGNHTKDKHLAEIRQGKGLRGKIRVNNKKAAIIRKNIRKDRDESTYGLENFDEELMKHEKELTDFSEQKRDALAVFNNSTSQVIATDIKGLYEEQLTTLRTEYDKARNEAAKAEDKINHLTIKIAKEYEPYIGKDLMTLDRLNALSNIIQAGSAETISEALAFYKQGMNGITQK
jgi:hypothetical protein